VISKEDDTVTASNSTSSDSYMKVNSKTIRCKVLDVKSNQTERTILVNGSTTIGMGKVVSYLQTVLSMKASGGTIKFTGWEK